MEQVKIDSIFDKWAKLLVSSRLYTQLMLVDLKGTCSRNNIEGI
jgi:hypothetical protein